MTAKPLNEQISARLAACREVVYALQTAANTKFGADRAELLALAHRIALCGEAANQFVCDDAINMSTGELYQAKGVMWRCGSKLCPNCIAIFAAKHRRQLRTQINKVKLFPKESWYFGTMTIPNPNLSLTATREIVNYAWSLYRKRLLSVSLIRGGAKSEEFTLTANGYHYHLHTLYIAKYHDWDEVRRVWTECVAEAFHEFHHDDIWNAYLVRRRRQNDAWNADHPEEKPRTDLNVRVVIKVVNNLDNIPNELCKYLTKSDSWYKMPKEHLAEVGLVRRWWRMFELGGCMRAQKTALTSSEPLDIESEDIVHTSSLSDGVSPVNQKLIDIMKPDRAEAWRDIQSQMSLENYKAFVGEQWSKAIGFRCAQIRSRWPNAVLYSANEHGELTAVPKDDREHRVALETVLRNLHIDIPAK